MYPFSCVLWAIFLVLFAPVITEAKMPQKLIPNHRTINSKQLLRRSACNAGGTSELDVYVTLSGKSNQAVFLPRLLFYA